MNYKKTVLVWLIFFVAGIYQQTEAGTSIIGKWKQVKSSAGNCSDCKITIKKITDHIIRINSSNGWTGFASEIENGAYEGFFEINAGRKGEWQNKVFMIQLHLDKDRLHLRADADTIYFEVDYIKVRSTK